MIEKGGAVTSAPKEEPIHCEGRSTPEQERHCTFRERLHVKTLQKRKKGRGGTGGRRPRVKGIVCVREASEGRKGRGSNCTWQEKEITHSLERGSRKADRSKNNGEGDAGKTRASMPCNSLESD